MMSLLPTRLTRPPVVHIRGTPKSVVALKFEGLDHGRRNATAWSCRVRRERVPSSPPTAHSIAAPCSFTGPKLAKLAQTWSTNGLVWPDSQEHWPMSIYHVPQQAN